MPRYLIQPGATFRMPDGSVKGPGDQIDLPEDVAAMHAHRVHLLPDPPADAPANQPTPDA